MTTKTLKKSEVESLLKDKRRLLALERERVVAILSPEVVKNLEDGGACRCCCESRQFPNPDRPGTFISKPYSETILVDPETGKKRKVTKPFPKKYVGDEPPCSTCHFVRKAMVQSGSLKVRHPNQPGS